MTDAIMPGRGALTASAYKVVALEQLVAALPQTAERLMVSGFCNASILEDGIAQAEAMLSDDAQELRRQSAPASNAEIEEFVTTIASAWNTDGRDLSTFAAFLAEHVMGASPSRYALFEGERRLRATFKWTPSIAGIVPVLTELNFLMGRALAAFSCLPDRLVRARAALATERAREMTVVLDYDQARAAYFAEKEAIEKGQTH